MAGVSVAEAEAMAVDNLKAMKAEYTRMRDIAQKRIKRLGKSEFAESKAFTRHPEGFQKLREMDPRDFAKAYSELSKFVNAKASTVTGQRSIKQKTIETWQQQGLNLNSKNYDKTIKILEELRKRKMVYGSDKVIELANAMIDFDDQKTKDWLNHLDELLPVADSLQEIPNLAGYSFDQVITMLGD